MSAHRLKLALAAFAATTALAGGASASVHFYSYGLGAPSLSLVTDFSADTTNHQPASLPAGLTWTGNGVVLNSTSGNGSEPAVNSSARGVGNYLSVESSHVETLNIPAAKGYNQIELYVGSLDSYNTIVFDLSDGSTATFTGTTLGGISGADDGDQLSALTNGIFDFTFLKPVTSIVFKSSQNSLEIKRILASAVPEPNTWAMMILGVAMIGLAIRRRREAAAPAAL